MRQRSALTPSRMIVAACDALVSASSRKRRSSSTTKLRNHRGRGPAFHEQACKLELEGIVSKRADAPYTPGNRLWVKVKCLHREEFVVVGWTDPEGSRPYLGALLLAYYDPDGRLVYAGRVGTGIKQAELERLWRRLQPLATPEVLLEVPPPRASRFGSPLVLRRRRTRRQTGRLPKPWGRVRTCLPAGEGRIRTLGPP